MRPKAVTFDLWNTLVHNRNYGEFRLPALRRILGEHGYSFDDRTVEDAYLGGFRHSSEIIKTQGYRHVEIEEIAGEVLRLLGVADDSVLDELVPMYERAVLLDPPKLKEGVFKALDYVRSRYRVGLISVTGVSYGRLIRGILEDHGILDYFEVLTFSDEIKWVKPSVKLYRSAIDSFDLSPREILHIGDSMKGDIVGAMKAGMRAVWVKTKEQGFVDGYEPDCVITSLLELPEALRALG